MPVTSGVSRWVNNSPFRTCTTYLRHSVVETTICHRGCGSLRSWGSSEGPPGPSSQMLTTVGTSHCWLQRGRVRWWPGYLRTTVCTLDLSKWTMMSRTWRPHIPSYATGAWSASSKHAGLLQVVKWLLRLAYRWFVHFQLKTRGLDLTIGPIRFRFVLIPLSWNKIELNQTIYINKNQTI